MVEKIRLVVWDLDETFWKGTLTEGGIEYLQSSHDIVVTLAQRGILSSICSKNDLGTIEALLKDKGLWEYFVFPSIDWTAKGPRLAQLVEATQLRAPTILFIDDNPMNLAEAVRFVEGIQVAEPSIIASLLENPLLEGKDDRDLSRLKQYKLLERRAGEMAKAPDSTDFLRESDITVVIEHDIESHIDRAIELVNRTNQLNFTKQRLSEDPAEARAELRQLLGRYDVVAGLVRVFDRYGDYGYVGFYAMNKSIDVAPVLLHYCFSCRTLGMQVETWLYRHLGRPEIQIEGSVVTDILAHEPIDWIKQSDGRNSEESSSRAKLPRVVLRGGCELAAISHYFTGCSVEVVEELAFYRNGLAIRVDDPDLLHMALAESSPAVLEATKRLGFMPGDFESKITEGSDGIYILSCWGVALPRFRHKQLHFVLPIDLGRLLGDASADLAKVDVGRLGADAATMVEELRNHYEFVRKPTIAEQSAELVRAIKRLPTSARIFLVAPPTRRFSDEGSDTSIEHHALRNAFLHEIAKMFANVSVVEFGRHVHGTMDQTDDPNHFSRSTYFRLFEEIRGSVEANTPVEHDASPGSGVHHVASLLRGRVASNEKCYDLAERFFRQSLAVDPGNEEARDGLLTALRHRDRTEPGAGPVCFRIAVTDRLLKHRGTIFPDGCLRMLGPAENFLWGPYIDLPAGHHAIGIAVEGAAFGFATLEVAFPDNGKLQVVSRCRFDLAALQTEDALTVNVQLEAPASRVECRLSLDDKSFIAVTGVKFVLFTRGQGPSPTGATTRGDLPIAKSLS